MGIGIKQKLDYSDLAHTPDDGRRYEIIEGELYVTPSPSPIHQRVSRRLQRTLEDYFHPRGLGEVFNAPLDVVLTWHDVVEPDLIVVADPGQITRRAIEGAPLLVVEILSPSTGPRDRTVKARRYAELGVPHYWMLDPDDRTLECYRLEGGAFRLVVRGQGDVSVAHPDWPGLTIDLTELWR